MIQPLADEKAIRRRSEQIEHNEAEFEAYRVATNRKASFKSRTVGRCMADVQPCEIRWIWPYKIPRARLTVLAGDGGVGKSFLSLSIAATLSRGASWPDACDSKQEPSNTVLLNAEDDASDTIRVRLDAAGADCSRIHIVEGVQRSANDDPSYFSLVDDLGALEDKITETNARLCIVDPIGAFTAGTDTHRDAAVRCILGPLAMLASRTDCGVLAILHLNKGATSKTSHRVTGSVAWTNAARMAWLVGIDPEDDTRRLFLPYKHNIVANPTGLAFEIVDGAVRWNPEAIEVDPDSILAADEGKAERNEAADWLSGLLAIGPMPVSEIRKALEEEAFGWRTVVRAKKSLRISSNREGYGKAGRFVWSLPTIECQGGRNDSIECQSEVDTQCDIRPETAILPIERQVRGTGTLWPNDG